MKSPTHPSLRVDPDLREAAERVLREGETLTSFFETPMRETILRRRFKPSLWTVAERESANLSVVYHAA